MKNITLTKIDNNKTLTRFDTYYIGRLSEVFKNDNIASLIVSFNGDGYVDYLDETKSLRYLRLSLMSFCMSRGIDPINIEDGIEDYEVHVNLNELMSEISGRLKRAEDNYVDATSATAKYDDRIKKISDMFIDYINSKASYNAKRKREIISMLS